MARFRRMRYLQPNKRRLIHDHPCAPRPRHPCPRLLHRAAPSPEECRRRIRGQARFPSRRPARHLRNGRDPRDPLPHGLRRLRRSPRVLVADNLIPIRSSKGPRIFCGPPDASKTRHAACCEATSSAVGTPPRGRRSIGRPTRRSLTGEGGQAQAPLLARFRIGRSRRQAQRAKAGDRGKRRSVMSLWIQEIRRKFLIAITGGWTRYADLWPRDAHNCPKKSQIFAKDAEFMDDFPYVVTRIKEFST